MKILKESAQIDATAEKDYLDGIQQGYIDIDAFHSAYDGIIKEAAAGLEGLFYKRGDKVLKSRGSYGNIKLMKGFNDPVYNAMVSLWVAQFKNKLPLKQDAMGAKQAAGSGEALSMSRAELVKLAVATLNKAKGVNFELADVEELSGGSVMFTMTYPSGVKSYWGFPNDWFNPEHKKSDAVKKVLKDIPADWTAEQKIVAKMMAYLWSVRDYKGW